MSVKPGSQNARILAVLADGRWHVSTELHQRCGYMRTNSRVSELRSHGHMILGESVPGKRGTDGYRYRRVGSPLSERALHGTGRGRMVAPVAERAFLGTSVATPPRSESDEPVQLAMVVA